MEVAVKERRKRERERKRRKKSREAATKSFWVRKDTIRSGGGKEEARGSVWVRMALCCAGGGVHGALEIDKIKRLHHQTGPQTPLAI